MTETSLEPARRLLLWPKAKEALAQRGQMGLAWLILLTVLLIVLPPLFMIILGSLTDSDPGSTPHFTLSTLDDTFSQISIYHSLLNSVIYATSTTVLSVAVSGAIAWLVERTDGAPRFFVKLMSIVPILLPAVVFTSAWIMLLNPTTGPVSEAWRLIAPSLKQIDGYSFSGMIFIGTLQDLPLAFLWLLPAFRSMNPLLEEAASMSGASTLTIMRRVSLPLVAPAIVAAALISFITGMSSLSVPLMVGLPSGIILYSTEVYLAVNRVPADMNAAGALCLLFLVLTIVTLYGYRKMLGDGSRFAVITGKAYAPKRISLGNWRLGSMAFCSIVFLALVVLPVFVIAWNAFMPFPQVPSLASIRVMTLKNFSSALNYGLTIRAVWNSLLLGLSTGLITTALGFCIAALKNRSEHTTLASFADQLGTAPITFPGILVGVSLMWTFLTVPAPVYGTRWILLIAYIIEFLPYAIRGCNTAFIQIHKELDEAAYMSGAGWFRSITKILIPLLAPNLILSVLYILLRTFREYAASIFLTSVGAEVFSVLVLDMWSGGNSNILAAYSIMVMGGLTILIGLLLWLSNRVSIAARSGKE